MLDSAANKETVTDVVRDRARADVRPPGEAGDAVTGLVLRVTAFVGYALLAVETVLGSLWALSGEFQAYMSFFH